MKKFWREYGLLGAIIVVSMAGYLYYQQNSQDVLAYSLDTIGDSLLEMVDPAGQSAVARLYDSFKSRVLEKNVAPQDVENVVVNVLNLRNSGSRLTEEEAELVLGMPFADVEPATPPGVDKMKIEAPPAPPRKPQHVVRVPPAPQPLRAPVPPEEYEALGERLRSVVSIDKEVHRIIAVDDGSDRTVASANVRYDCDDGIKITIDDKLRPRLALATAGPIARSLQRFEKQKRLVWKEDLANDVAKAREVVATRHARVTVQMAEEARAHQQHVVEVERARAAGHALAALRKLEGMGYLSPIDIDSVMIVVERELTIEGTR